MNYIGDYPQDQTIYFMWNTNDSAGASADRSTAGTVVIYKDDGTTQVSTGVTDTENFDSTDLGNGVQMCKIITTDAFYAPAKDYFVVIDQMVVDGQTVSACIAHFSIENRTGSPQAGANEITYTVREDDEDSGTLMEGCTVWITTDSAGSNVIWSGVTDSNGIAKTVNGSKPWLDAGTYYFWRQKSNWNFDNPDTETFS
jgi:hypothetical protein